MAIQWMALCVAAAMICAMLRTQRPELATAVSLAVGAAVLVMLADKLGTLFPEADKLLSWLSGDEGVLRTAILRSAGVTLIGQLGAELCADAGERALAGRIALIARATVVMACVPVVAQLVELLRQFSL